MQKYFGFKKPLAVLQQIHNDFNKVFYKLAKITQDKLRFSKRFMTRKLNCLYNQKM